LQVYRYDTKLLKCAEVGVNFKTALEGKQAKVNPGEKKLLWALRCGCRPIYVSGIAAYLAEGAFVGNIAEDGDCAVRRQSSKMSEFGPVLHVVFMRFA